MRLIELSQLTLLNAMAIAAFSLAMLFHVIAYTTDHWCTFKNEGIEWNVGLWRGCWRNATDNTQLCTTEIFKESWFTKGRSSHWSQGTSGMMTVSLICLFLLELTVICYACVKQLERFRDRIVGVVLAFSCASGFFHFVALLLYGMEANGNLPESSVSWSYGITFIPLVMEISVPVLVKYDRYRGHANDDTSLKTDGQNLKQNSLKTDEYDKTKKSHHKPDVSKAEDSPYTIEDASQTAAIDISFTSLPEYTRRPSFSGSLDDILFYQQSAEFSTNLTVPYGVYYEESSKESLV